MNCKLRIKWFFLPRDVKLYLYTFAKKERIARLKGISRKLLIEMARW